VLISNFEVILDPPLFKVTWNNLVPSKLSLFAWRLLKNRHLTKHNLIHRGLHNSASLLCAERCDMNETSNHLFFECPISGKL